jgi:alpha/beta hydrolase family protein
MVDAISAALALLSVDTPVVELAAQRLRAVAGVLRSAANRVRLAAVPQWSGAGHDAALAAIDRLGRQLTARATAAETASAVLTALASALQTVQAEAQTARRVLAAAGPQVQGAVSRQVDDALQRFDDADRRAAAVLADAYLGISMVQRVGPLTVAPLQRSQLLTESVVAVSALPSTPAAVAVWWAGLTPDARARLTSGWSWLAGGLDGVPAPVRDAVNRRRLAYALGDAQRTFAAQHPPDLTQLLAAAARVAELQALSQTLRRTPGSELLAFDATGDGRAVVASGDVEAGRSLAVFVPGMDNELADVPRLAEQANRLAHAAGPGVVVVTWLGYDTPRLFQVASDGLAKRGAGELQRFTAGVRSTGRERQHVTIVSHSYGTLVTGIAAKRGLAADDVVLLASPGVEAARARDLHLPPGHVWAARAATDPIQAVYWPARLGRLFGLPIPEVFGPDPASAAFGAHHFGVGGAFGHSGYFTTGSQSLDNLGRIVSGRAIRP